MRTRSKSITPLLLILILASVTVAQRPRAINDTTQPATTTPSAPAPQTVKAKYEGGVFGYPRKINGTLTLDDPNNRLLLRDGKRKEVFSIPYGSITGAYGDTHSVQPASATVVSHVPLYGIPASFIKTKVRYLTIQYNDPDSKQSGITSFRLENKDILDSVLNYVANKAGLTKRGEVFIKKQE